MDIYRFHCKGASLWADRGGYRFSLELLFHQLSLNQTIEVHFFLPYENSTGIQNVLSTTKQSNGEKGEEQTLNLANIVDHDKLLFSVFSLLQNLGADERPEVYLLVIILGLAVLFYQNFLIVETSSIFIYLFYLFHSFSLQKCLVSLIALQSSCL